MESTTLSLFLLISSAMVVVLYFIHRVRSNARLRELTKSLNTVRDEIKTLHTTEKHLLEENTNLQNKLNYTFSDTVTKLLGWQVFEDRLSQSVKESERHLLTLAVLFVDIDNFRMINDALSYEVGDMLLQQVGQRLNTCIRQVDSMSRFTKDTFVILLTQLAKAETAVVVTQRILQSLQEPFQVQDHELYITACVGVSIFPADGQDAGTLLRSADHALHLAKQKGKNHYQFYQEKLHTISQRELAVYTSLGRETIFQESKFFYQPIMNIQQHRVACLDVLLYWQHPELGLIEPQDLYHYAEKQRKLNIVSEWLIRSACTQFKKWRAEGLTFDLLGIPLLAVQLENSHFIYRISQILQELEFKPEWLLLEIQESVARLPFDVLERAFNMLQFMGVKIAIDNFGMGNFPLRHLKNLGIDYLRLDKSLIEDIHDPQTIALLKSVVALTENMAMQIIIQGVETKEQLAALQDLGCVLMQGTFLGTPLPGQEISAKRPESV